MGDYLPEKLRGRKMAAEAYSNNELVSVIILNYNAKAFLNDLLNSVLNSTYANIEIIFVDNHSNDNSVNFIREKFGHLSNFKIVVNEQNVGFNEGNNIGFRHSKGVFCLFMNPDVKLSDSTTIEKLVGYLSLNEKIGIISPVLLNYDSDIVQTAGVYLSFRNFEYGKGESYVTFRKTNPVPFQVAITPGAFFLVRRKLITEIGLFDKIFFMQGDIDDLCLRAWKRGYEVFTLPTVTAMHYEGASIAKSYKSSSQRLLRGYYHGIRADLAVIIKNLGFKNVVKFLSFKLAIYFVEAMVLSLKFKNANGLTAYFKSISWNIKHFRLVYSSRKKVQAVSLRQDNDFMPFIMGNCGITSYLRRFRSFRA